MSESAIHDLGYKRYVGGRLPPSTRWRVIMRHQVAAGWKTFWRYKAWMLSGVIVTVIAAVFIFVANDRHWTSTGKAGEVIKRTFSDMSLPFAFDWYGRLAFIITLRMIATLIATDVQSGAFTFYFARSTRVIDYMLGKLCGCMLLIGGMAIGGGFIVASMRVGMAGAENVSDVVSQLWILPRALAIGAIITVAYSAIPLAFSALIANRRAAMGVWAAWYLIVGLVASGFGAMFHLPLGAIDLALSIRSITLHLLDDPFTWFGQPISMLPSLNAALISIFVQIAAALAIVYFSLVRAQREGIGGSS